MVATASPRVSGPRLLLTSTGARRAPRGQAMGCLAIQVGQRKAEWQRDRLTREGPPRPARVASSTPDANQDLS